MPRPNTVLTSLHGRRVGLSADGKLVVNEDGRNGLGDGAECRLEGVARTTLTAAQVAAAFTTPIAIVPAPGALFVTVVNRVVISKAAGTAFGGIAAGEDIQIEYETSGTPVVADVETTGFLDATTAEIRITRAIAAASGIGGIDLTANLNKKIMFSLLTGDLTGGSPVIVDTYFERFPSFLV